MRIFLLTVSVFAVIFVNGWTDAPNSISGIVVTGVLPFRRAAAFAAICECFGIIVTSLLCPAIAETIFSIADFTSSHHTALTALQAALLTIVLWSVLAWRRGIPTSESHALTAALTGASVAVHGNFDGISPFAWRRILFGLIFSTVLGSLLGYAASHISRVDSLSHKTVKKGHLLSCGGMAFFHGAQDGQKFVALLLLVNACASGQTTNVFSITFFPAATCACLMSLGVFLGGRRIINTIAQGMGHSNPKRGLAVDLAASFCLLLTTALGLPVSTTHTKISALLGSGAALSSSQASKLVALRILFIWLITFPCCGLLAWGLTCLLL